MSAAAHDPGSGATPRPPSPRALGVVGFLARSRDRLLLSRRLARWRDDPSPATLVDAVQTLLRLGEVERAYAIARQGVTRMKGDALVHELWRIATRAHAEEGLVVARAEIRAKPSASAFLRVARCSALLRDSEGAMRALEECLRLFPTTATAHAALAELLEQRWHRDLAAADGRLVLTHFRKAWRLDGAEATRPMRLAAFLARIGAVRAALAVAEEVLQLHEDVSDARALRDSLAQVVEKGLAAGTLEAAHGDDVDGLLRHIEESGRVAGDPGEATRVARESARLCAALPSFRARTACEKALVIEPKGDAFDERGPLGASSLASLAANLARSAQVTVRRLDLGPLGAVEMETAGGTLLLKRGQRCFVGALFDQPESDTAARAALEELAAGRTPIAAPSRGNDREARR